MESKSLKDSLLRGIALLGLILILVLGAWGIIVLAFNVPNLLSSAGTTISGLFGGEREVDENNEDDTVEVPVVAPTTSTKPAKTTPSAQQPTYTYTPASAPAVQLYGFPDLAVRILSVVPQGSRYAMHFEITNVGTNTAGAGWMFTARLPLKPEYNFTSGPQQALRPGDKVVYTLGFDAPYYGYDHDDDYDDEDEERYDECGENNHWDAEEWFDWYQDTWDTNSDSREDWDEDQWEDWYDDFCDDRDEDDNDDDYRSSGTVTVTANPFGQIYESNRFNNTASQRVNFNYYPYYPSYPYPQYPWGY